ncbi:MAG: hypothetical protein ACYT04_90260, partial [Nostoc sp.]
MIQIILCANHPKPKPRLEVLAKIIKVLTLLKDFRNSSPAPVQDPSIAQAKGQAMYEALDAAKKYPIN